MSWTFLSFFSTSIFLWGPGGMKPRHESDDYSIPKVKLGRKLQFCTSWDASDTGKLTDPSKCHKWVSHTSYARFTCLLTWWHGFFQGFVLGAFRVRMVSQWVLVGMAKKNRNLTKMQLGIEGLILGSSILDLNFFGVVVITSVCKMLRKFGWPGACVHAYTVSR